MSRRVSIHVENCFNSLYHKFYRYQSHTGVSCQFFWTKIQTPAGYAGTRWAALIRGDHNISIGWTPGTKDEWICRSKNMDRWRSLCDCQMKWPAINAEHQFCSL